MKRYLFIAVLVLTISSSIWYIIITNDSSKTNQVPYADSKSSWAFEAINYFEENPGHQKVVQVAILDSGISPHEDLEGKVTKSYNTIDDNPILDDYGHGTAIAGIITANNNDIGITGVSQNIELFDVKVLDENGKGEIENLEKGIEWCITEKADIINISFGVQVDNKDLKEAIDKAVEKGIIIVAAAGNTYGLGVDYPAKYDNVLSINSINSELVRAGSAAKGKIDFIAPGEKILSTSKNGRYEYFSGTSFSAAFATGIIARHLQGYKDINSYAKYQEFIEKVKRSVIKKGDTKEYGNGLLVITKE